MMELEQELRTTSDEMMSTLDQLAQLETEKRDVQPGTPRFRQLAHEIERLAAMVFAQTHAQQNLADRSETVADRTGAQLDAINEVTAARDVQVILTEWRDAERRLAASAMDTAEHAKAAADITRLRAEYHRSYQEATRPDKPTRP